MVFFRQLEAIYSHDDARAAFYLSLPGVGGCLNFVLNEAGLDRAEDGQVVGVGNALRSNRRGQLASFEMRPQIVHYL